MIELLFGIDIGILPFLVIYSICSFGGLLGFIAILLLGGLFDIGDVDVDADVGGIDVGNIDLAGGPSPFSLPIIMFYVLSFGSIGLILIAFGVRLSWTPLISIVISIVPAGASYLVIWYLFTKLQTSLVEGLAEFKGVTGKVSVNIRPPAEGQVVLPSTSRGFIQVGAVADEFIARGQDVVVLNSLGSSIKVKPTFPHSKGSGKGRTKGSKTSEKKKKKKTDKDHKRRA